MNRQRLEFFVDVAETLNYTETAERLYTSQGNVSKQILALEKELGVPLFLREHRKIRLTPIGEEVLQEAQKILQSFQELDEVLHTYRLSQDHQMTLYGLPTMSAYRITNLIGQFHQQYPHFLLNIEEEEGTELGRSLKSNRCQLIFNRYFEDELPTEDYVVVEEDELVAVLPQSHPLAGQKEVALRELEGEAFLQLGHSSRIYQKILETCQKAGFTPKITYQGKRINYILEFVAQNMGVSLMMRKSIEKFVTPEIVLVPLKEVVTCKLCLVKKEQMDSKAASMFWEFVNERL